MKQSFGLSRSGFAAVYLALMLVVLAGFAAMGVDLARLRLGRAELQVAADAGARAAAWVLPSDPSTARSRAVALAAANTCFGLPVTLDPNQDINIGIWSNENKTFTPLSGDVLPLANAIRVTARRTAARGNALSLPFASVFGRNQADVQAVAIAVVLGGTIRYGITGIDWAYMNGITLTDSYDSSKGPYDPAFPGSNGSVTTNGYLDLNGNLTIRGDVHPGTSGTIYKTSNVNIIGTDMPLPQAINFPSVDASPYSASNNDSYIPSTYLDSNRNFILKANKTYDMPAGTYYFRDFVIHGTATLNVKGPVTIYVTGSISIAGTTNTNASRPDNLRINVSGAGSVSLAGTSYMYADLYAPQSAVTLSGNYDLFGSVVGKTLSITGKANVHYDESLNRQMTIAQQVSLVQ